MTHPKGTERNEDQLRQTVSQLDRERTAMELIHASLGSGPWSILKAGRVREQR